MSQNLTLHPFLFLKRENGENGAATWEPDLTVGGVLPTGYMTLSGGEWHSDDVESVSSVITEDGRPTGYSLTLNTGEKPRTPIRSKLSDVLERNPDHKYDLSAKACLGILNRAERRGKELPPELKAALIAQSASKGTESTEQTPPDAMVEDGGGGAAIPLTPSTDPQSCRSKNEQESRGGAKESSFSQNTQEHCQLSTIKPCLTEESDCHQIYGIDQQGGKGAANYTEDVAPPILSDSHGTPHAVAYSFDSVASNSMKSSNPNSGCREVEISKTLDCFDPNPSKNQGGIAIVEPTVYNGECITSPTNKANPKQGDPCHTLTDDSRNYVVAFSQNQREEVRDLGEVAGAVSSEAGTHQQTFVALDLYNVATTGDVAVTINANSGTSANHAGPTVLTVGFKAGQSKDGGLGDEVEKSPTLSATPSALEPTVLVAGFSMGQSEKARSIGYQEEISPTIRGGEGGNQKPCIVCANPWDSQAERVYHGDGAWHGLNSNSNGGQSRDAILQCKVSEDI